MGTAFIHVHLLPAFLLTLCSAPAAPHTRFCPSRQCQHSVSLTSAFEHQSLPPVSKHRHLHDILQYCVRVASTSLIRDNTRQDELEAPPSSASSTPVARFRPISASSTFPSKRAQ